jgi:hypothetical protein
MSYKLLSHNDLVGDLISWQAVGGQGAPDSTCLAKDVSVR